MEKIECLSDYEIKNKDIYERLFDKRVDDKRYLEKDVQKFLLQNKKMFSFLGVDIEMNGTGKDLSIKLKTSGYIGAIPIKMPYDGIVHKDFPVFPRFDDLDDNSNQNFSDLTRLLGKLEYSISPEYADGEELVSPLQLRPPMYYEASKFIDLFEQAQKQHWVKFEVIKGNHHFPKSNTDWSKYSRTASDPIKALIYPSSDSVLSVNHKEWQQLKYVFDMAKSIIMQPNVPASIRYKYQDKIEKLQKKNEAIKPLITTDIQVHTSDPRAIKEAKNQGNTLLQKGATSCVAWRIDMAMLFERYIQYIVSKSLWGLDGKVLSNSKILGRGQIAPWGLRHLEPDMIIKINSNIYMADAKYKSHSYNKNRYSDFLKETHRSDLHQLLAYCSFSPKKDKVGFLFYPSKTFCFRKVNYFERFDGVNNTVYLIEIPFGINKIDTSIAEMRNLFSHTLI